MDRLQMLTSKVGTMEFRGFRVLGFRGFRVSGF